MIYSNWNYALCLLMGYLFKRFGYLKYNEEDKAASFGKLWKQWKNRKNEENDKDVDGDGINDDNTKDKMEKSIKNHEPIQSDVDTDDENEMEKESNIDDIIVNIESNSPTENDIDIKYEIAKEIAKETEMYELEKEDVITDINKATNDGDVPKTAPIYGYHESTAL